jgi:predicted ATPase
LGKLEELQPRKNLDIHFWMWKSRDAEAYLAIYETKELGPDEDTILANDQRSREWTGRLPVKGEYSVQVYDASENGINRAAYTIEISLR